MGSSYAELLTFRYSHQRSRHMRIEPSPVSGIWDLISEPIGDERGWFSRLVDTEQFAEEAIPFTVYQANASFNAQCGTLRGMHFQTEPHGEIKVVRCTRGAIFDVGVDIDPNSPTYLQWHGVELTPDNGHALLLGPRIAHGFQTLLPDSEVHYLMGTPYLADAQAGIRWDDPAIAIEWPADPEVRIISERDRSFPLLP